MYLELPQRQVNMVVKGFGYWSLSPGINFSERGKIEGKGKCYWPNVQAPKQLCSRHKDSPVPDTTSAQGISWAEKS